jgi:hypothetical protein
LKPCVLFPFFSKHWMWSRVLRRRAQDLDEALNFFVYALLCC